MLWNCYYKTGMKAAEILTDCVNSNDLIQINFSGYLY